MPAGQETRLADEYQVDSVEFSPKVEVFLICLIQLLVSHRRWVAYGRELSTASKSPVAPRPPTGGDSPLATGGLTMQFLPRRSRDSSSQNRCEQVGHFPRSHASPHHRTDLLDKPSRNLPIYYLLSTTYCSLENFSSSDFFIFGEAFLPTAAWAALRAVSSETPVILLISSTATSSHSNQGLSGYFMER